MVPNADGASHLDLVDMSTLPKDVFRQRRTALALTALKKALDRVEAQLLGETKLSIVIAQMEARCQFYSFLGDTQRAEKCEALRDRYVQKEMARKAAGRRRKRTRRVEPTAEQSPYSTRRETPVDQKAVSNGDKKKPPR